MSSVKWSYFDSLNSATLFYKLGFLEGTILCESILNFFCNLLDCLYCKLLFNLFSLKFSAPPILLIPLSVLLRNKFTLKISLRRLCSTSCRRSQVMRTSLYKSLKLVVKKTKILIYLFIKI